ncbi:MAG: hypothetical protein KAU28_10815, partial [Phycisphaerae bacterium]|nr:hypothetical protein [Phycisphaerae bacterium]
MSDGELVMLGAPAMSERLAVRLGDSEVASHEDPYDFLLALARRRWRAVVLTGQQADFPGLCRASRRLQRDSRLVAVCSPSAEMTVRPLAGEVIDDYFIFPPTRRELATLRGAVSVQGPREGLAEGEAAGLAPREYGQLLEAARTARGLEQRIAAMVGRRLGTEVSWQDADAPSGESV